MSFPHAKREPKDHGHSPGNGITNIPLSQAPLATEGEATPGPDDYNPYNQREYEQEMNGDSAASMPDFEQRDPTKGDDPFAFDDAGAMLTDLELPGSREANGDFDLPGGF